MAHPFLKPPKGINLGLRFFGHSQLFAAVLFIPREGASSCRGGTGLGKDTPGPLGCGDDPAGVGAWGREAGPSLWKRGQAPSLSRSRGRQESLRDAQTTGTGSRVPRSRAHVP